MNSNTLTSEHDLQMSELLKREYWCFISYRHLDNKQPGRQWATWLHQALETYEVPSDLVGTKNERGDTIPERIYPVFRDEDELPADAELTRPINAALARSRLLLVLCSPQSVKSRWVEDEIMTFKRMGKQDRILAAIIEGNPNADECDPNKPGARTECFPMPMRFELGEDGQLSDQKTEPMAADFRLADGGMGWTSPAAYRESLESANVPLSQITELVTQFSKRQNLMLLKIIAGVLGVSVGVLTQRDKAYRLEIERKRTKALQYWLAIIGALAVIALTAGAFAWFKQNEADSQRKVAEQQRNLAQDNEKKAKRERDVAREARAGADEFMSYLQNRLLPELDASQKSAFAPEIHEKVQQYLDATAIDSSDVMGAHERIRLFLSRAEGAEEKGKLGEALKLCTTAQRIVAQIDREIDEKGEVGGVGNAEIVIRGDSVGVSQRIAAIFVKQGSHEMALGSLDGALADVKRMKELAPLEGHPVVEEGKLQYARGKSLQALGREEEALAAYYSSVAAYEPLAKTSQLAGDIESHAVSYAALVRLTEKNSPDSVAAIMKKWSDLLGLYTPKEAHFGAYSNAKTIFTVILAEHYTKTKDWQGVIGERRRQAELIRERNAKTPFPDASGLIREEYLKAIKVANGELKDSKITRELHEGLISILAKVTTGGDYQSLRVQAFAHNDFGDFLRESGSNIDLIAKHYAKSLEIMELTQSLRDGGPDSQRDLAIAHQRLGIAASLTGKLEEALTQHHEEMKFALKAQTALLEREATKDQAARFFCDIAAAAQNKVEVLQKLYLRDQNANLLIEAMDMLDSVIEMGKRYEATDEKTLASLNETRSALHDLRQNVEGMQSPSNSANLKVVVSGVIPDGQAMAIGLQAGDIVISYNNEKVSDTNQLVELTGNATGSNIPLIIGRQGKTLRFAVKGGRLGVQIKAIK